MSQAVTNNLEAFWMPFTANRQFKKNPRMLVGAKDMHYTAADGRQILDGTAGLWCCNAGHGRPKVVEAIQKQAAELDYAPAFQMGHPKAFELAARLSAMMPKPLDHVFFTNSGSESVETALKTAIAYHRAKGNAAKTRLIGRQRGYHGVNFGGISVGGISGNRKMFGSLLTGVDHIRDTHDIERNAFTRGQPEHGAEFADDLLNVIKLHDASTIAAVIVEPMAGSTGVLIPPKGYLERLRKICDDNDILLIFDEVITGFGRLGSAFAVDHFGVVPDMVTTAKGLTSGTVPMGAVFVSSSIYEAFMQGPEHMIEFFHGYTYSGHPLACAAALGTLDTYEDEGLMTRGAELADHWADALHSLKDHPHVIDIRNMGLIGAVELEPIAGEPTKRAFSAFLKAFEEGLMIRTTGDIIALSPPLIISRAQIDEVFGILGKVLKAID
ncbi:beta-alanine--pyruvate transaminase [Breoghania corrubedonensis]|uniref:Beta-alanine--pyruvate transaminase n=1 Tax=Breoghania corrubedonensis TaxID=665038 RepID=A0A2T5V7L3_9HYPH|nr:aspartate aminotransferase family protein [Breoghania corrubedonensis]PTW59747.1 beta-alanine--pyruvate transaminase [Breoghania corrubedonensis]